MSTPTPPVRPEMEVLDRKGLEPASEIEKIARALHVLDCHDAAEDYRRDGLTPPETWADPWLPTGIRQLEILRRRAAVLSAALIAALHRASAPEQAVKGLWNLHRVEHRKLGELLTDKSPEGREASNWQGGKVNGIGAAIDALSLKENIPEPVAGVINGSPIASFVRDYQFDASDEGIVYPPTFHEQCMIEDAICSFISEPSNLAAALSRTASREGWRTMDSAPKNGDKFLAYEKGRYFDCWWHENGHGEEYWMDDADSEPNPSDWMPLPAGPNTGGTA